MTKMIFHSRHLVISYTDPYDWNRYYAPEGSWWLGLDGGRWWLYVRFCGLELNFS